MAEELYIGLGGGGGGTGGSFTAGASTGGNTAGTTGTVSNGLLFFGGANITLSESSGAGGATLSIVGGAGAAFSGGVSTGGNSAGTTGTVGNGIRFFGGNNITLSQSSAAGGATISFVGPNTSAQQTGISGIAGSGASTVTNGTVQFSNANGVSFGLNGSTMTASVSQSVQTQGSVQINGSTGAISFNAGNLMSLSTVASNLTFINVLSSSGIAQNVSNVSSAGTLSSRFALADHAHIGLAGVNASGTASTFVGNLMLSGTNLTLVTGGNSSAGSLGFSVAAQTVESQSIGMSNLGNTSGTSGIASGGQVRFLFAGGNNITLSQSINGASGTITISGGAGGAFTGGVSTQGNTSGTTGTVNNGIVFVGGNNITLSQSSGAGGATVTISAPSGGGVGVSTGGNTLGTTGTVDFQMVFVGGTNITLSQSTNGSSGTITIVGASGGGGGVAIGMTNTGNTSGTTFSSSSGTMYFQGTNNVTVSNSSAAGAQTLWISGPSGGGAGMGTGANTSGTSGTVGDQLFFYGGANISLSQSVTSGSASLSIIGAAQTVESQSIGASNLGNTQGTSGMASGGQVRFAIVGSNNITLSQSINGASGTISIIGGAGGAFSGGVSTGGNTLGGTGTVGSQLVFVGSNNITLSQSINGASATITISGPSGGGGAAIGMTNTGNTSGTNFTTATGTVYFQGTQNITVSNSSAAGSLQTLWISGPTGGGAGMGSTSNTFGTSGTVGKELYFYGGNQVSLSQSVNGGSASLTILGEPLRSKFYWMPDGAVSSSAMTHGSASFQVVMVPYDLSFTRVDIPILIASTSSATTNTCAFVISSGCVIYSVSNNSTLNPIIGSFGTTTHTFASNTAGNQSLSGGRFASFAMGTSLSAGWYVVGFQLSTANTSSVGASTTAIPFAVSVLLGSNYTASGFNDLGSASPATTDVAWGRGVANSTITATNATMNINGITGTGVSKFRGNFHVLFRAIS